MKLKNRLKDYGVSEVKKNNNRVSLRHLYDEIIPMIENIAGIQKDVENIKDDIKDIKDTNKSFVRRPAFFGWLAALSVAIGIAITLIKLL